MSFTGHGLMRRPYSDQAITNTTVLRTQLEADMAAYLAKGGTITTVGHQTPAELQTKMQRESAIARQRARSSMEALKSGRLTRTEAAARLGILSSHLTTLARQGRGPAFVHFGRASLYEPDEVDRWAATNPEHMAKLRESAARRTGR